MVEHKEFLTRVVGVVIFLLIFVIVYFSPIVQVSDELRLIVGSGTLAGFLVAVPALAWSWMKLKLVKTDQET